MIPLRPYYFVLGYLPTCMALLTAPSPYLTLQLQEREGEDGTGKCIEKEGKRKGGKGREEEKKE